MWGRWHYGLYSRFADHEKEIEKFAKQLSFSHVSLSSNTMLMARIVPRGFAGAIVFYLL